MAQNGPGLRRSRQSRRRPPRPWRPPTPLSSAHWKAQKQAWARLVKKMAPLARKGAWLPTAKLRKHFRRQGIWHHPSFDPAKQPAPRRRLLSPAGPTHHRAVNGPAGRAVFVQDRGADKAAREARRRLLEPVCATARRRCGLRCTFAPAQHPPLSARRRRLLRSVRLSTDHDLCLVIEGAPTRDRPVVRLTLPRAEPRLMGASRAARRWVHRQSRQLRQHLRPVHRLARRLLRRGPWALEPARLAPLAQGLQEFHLGLELRLPRGRGVPKNGLAELLCRLADHQPDRVDHAWSSTRIARAARYRALSQRLGLRFVERPVARGRPPLEHRYIRQHYRRRVFNLRRRAPDRAYLIRPQMVVIHNTGSTNLQSALYTLRSPRLGQRSGRHLVSGTLGVGVPYLTSRDGRIFRLFRNDNRFGRHTIGLNHSAVGIENVGNRHHPLTPRQIEVNARLVELLALRYPIRWLIGHREVYQMVRTGYYLEAVPGYCSDKIDPTWKTLRRLRRRLAYLGLERPPSPPPQLRSCSEMFRHFKRIRRRRRRKRRLERERRRPPNRFGPRRRPGPRHRRP